MHYAFLIALLRLCWSIRRHYARLKLHHTAARFRFPPGQTLAFRTLLDVSLTAMVSVGEATFGLLNPSLIASIVRAYLASSTLRGARYGPHAMNVADVLFPQAGSESAVAAPSNSPLRRPVIVFVRGGAWAWGMRVAYASFCQALATATGAVVVNADYRVYPHGGACEMAADIVACLKWCRDSAAQWGCDSEHLVLCGHSAGAHLVLLASTLIARAAAAQAPLQDAPATPLVKELPPEKALGDGRALAPATRAPAHSCALPPESLACAGELSAALRCCVGFAGVYHIADHHAHEASRVLRAGQLTVARGVAHVSPMHPAMGGHADFDAHSPSLAVGALSRAQVTHMPRILLLHGDADAVVPSRSSERLHGACLLAGVRCTLRVVPGQDHATALVEAMRGGGEGEWVLAAARSACAAGNGCLEEGADGAADGGDAVAWTAAMAAAAVLKAPVGQGVNDSFPANT